jgi:hypothetical protein
MLCDYYLIVSVSLIIKEEWYFYQCHLLSYETCVLINTDYDQIQHGYFLKFHLIYLSDRLSLSSKLLQ